METSMYVSSCDLFSSIEPVTSKFITVRNANLVCEMNLSIVGKKGDFVDATLSHKLRCFKDKRSMTRRCVSFL